MQPDGTNLNFFFTEQNDYATTTVFDPPNTAPQPLALNTVGTVKITHDEVRLLSVYLNDVLVDSGIHANILDMGVERFHLGYGGAGNATFTNINVSAVAAPTVTDVDLDDRIHKSQTTFETTIINAPTATTYEIFINGIACPFVSRLDTVFTWTLPAGCESSCYCIWLHNFI